MRKFIFTDGKTFYPVLKYNRGDNYELFFHKRHGLLDDATQLLTKEEIDYIEDVVRKLDIHNKHAIFVEAEDGSVSLAVAYPDVWYKNRVSYPGRLLSTEFEECYNLTVSTVWRLYAYFQIDAPFRYGEKTKAFYNLRKYLLYHDNRVVTKFERTNNTTTFALSPTSVPRLFEREVFYKTKDLRPWLDYIGLCPLEDFDEPITEMNDETLKQLFPYIARYLKEHNIGYKSKAVTSKSKEQQGLACGEYLFNIQSGDLVLEKVEFKKTDSLYNVFGNSKYHNPIIQTSFLEFLNQHRTPYGTKTLSNYLSDSFDYRYEIRTLLRFESSTKVVSHDKYSDLLSNIELTPNLSTSSLARFIKQEFAFFRIFQLEYATSRDETETGLAIVFKLKEGGHYGLRIHSFKYNKSFLSHHDTVETTIVQMITKLFRYGNSTDNIGRHLNIPFGEGDPYFDKDEHGDSYLHASLKSMSYSNAYYSDGGD